MLLELQAFLHPLGVLRHVQLTLLGRTGYPRHQLPVNHHLLLGAHKHLPELLQPPLHLPDDPLPLLHLQQAPPGRLKLHAGAGGDQFGGGGRGRSGRGIRTGQESPCYPPKVSHGDGPPGCWRRQSQESRGRHGRRHGGLRKRGGGRG